MPKQGTLTKADIINAVAEQNGFTQKKSYETMEIMLEIIKSSLECGKDVLIKIEHEQSISSGAHT